MVVGQTFSRAFWSYILSAYRMTRYDDGIIAVCGRYVNARLEWDAEAKAPERIIGRSDQGSASSM